MTTNFPTKVGAVVLRGSAENGYEFLVCQPKGKGTKPGQPPMGFVRGTRKYNNGKTWQDAPRDGAPLPEGVQWEPTYETLASELAEEAGISPKLLGSQQVLDMGVQPFQSKDKAPYPIHWFVVKLDIGAQQEQKRNNDIGIDDSKNTEWKSRAELAELAQVDDIDATRLSPGYLAVADEAVKQLAAGGLKDAARRSTNFGAAQGSQL